MLLAFALCTGACTIDFCNRSYLHGVMKADLRISIKDYHRNKSLKILLFRAPFPCRQFLVRMDGAAWPAGRDGVIDAAGDGPAQVAGEGQPRRQPLSPITLTKGLKRLGVRRASIILRPFVAGVNDKVVFRRLPTPTARHSRCRGGQGVTGSNRGSGKAPSTTAQK